MPLHVDIMSIRV